MEVTLHRKQFQKNPTEFGIRYLLLLKYLKNG